MTGWILEKCEDAWTNYLSGSVTSSVVHCYRGNEEVTKDGPAIITYATEAEEVEMGSGVYRVNVVVHYAHPFDSGSLPTRNTMAQELVRAMYYNNNIVNELTGSTNNLNILAMHFNAHNNGFDNDCYISNNLVEMVVAHT